MAGLDSLLGASVDAVKRSGAIENSALMATVAMVNTDGTVDVSRAGDTYPSVRLLTGYLMPTVGDSVEIIKTAGGWVCVGRLQTVTPTPQWVSVTLASGYTNNGNSNGTVQYRRIVDHGSVFVEWCGGMSWTTSGTPANGGTFYTMPSGFRPLSRRSVAAAAGGVPVKVDFGTDGICSIVAPSGVTTWCSVNGVRYRID
ncbi:hypothetical protein ACFW81_02585 [Streptomyces angustmyceticus]|uniref:hypothetical protein n=1 Tax=Streptomyces angustmyceticus TaxID=285578 RepID=UPI0036AEABA0